MDMIIAEGFDEKGVPIKIIMENQLTVEMGATPRFLYEDGREVALNQNELNIFYFENQVMPCGYIWRDDGAIYRCYVPENSPQLALQGINIRRQIVSAYIISSKPDWFKKLSQNYIETLKAKVLTKGYKASGQDTFEEMKVAHPYESGEGIIELLPAQKDIIESLLLPYFEKSVDPSLLQFYVELLKSAISGTVNDLEQSIQAGDPQYDAKVALAITARQLRHNLLSSSINQTAKVLELFKEERTIDAVLDYYRWLIHVEISRYTKTFPDDLPQQPLNISAAQAKTVVGKLNEAASSFYNVDLSTEQQKHVEIMDRYVESNNGFWLADYSQNELHSLLQLLNKFEKPHDINPVELEMFDVFLINLRADIFDREQAVSPDAVLKEVNRFKKFLSAIVADYQQVKLLTLSENETGELDENQERGYNEATQVPSLAVLKKLPSNLFNYYIQYERNYFRILKRTRPEKRKDFLWLVQSLIPDFFNKLDNTFYTLVVLDRKEWAEFLTLINFNRSKFNMPTNDFITTFSERTRNKSDDLKNALYKIFSPIQSSLDSNPEKMRLLLMMSNFSTGTQILGITRYTKEEIAQARALISSIRKPGNSETLSAVDQDIICRFSIALNISVSENYNTHVRTKILLDSLDSLLLATENDYDVLVQLVDEFPPIVNIETLAENFEKLPSKFIKTLFSAQERIIAVLEKAPASTQIMIIRHLMNHVDITNIVNPLKLVELLQLESHQIIAELYSVEKISSQVNSMKDILTYVMLYPKNQRGTIIDSLGNKFSNIIGSSPSSAFVRLNKVLDKIDFDDWGRIIAASHLNIDQDFTQFHQFIQSIIPTSKRVNVFNALVTKLPLGNIMGRSKKDSENQEELKSFLALFPDTDQRMVAAVCNYPKWSKPDWKEDASVEDNIKRILLKEDQRSSNSWMLGRENPQTVEQAILHNVNDCNKDLQRVVQVLEYTFRVDCQSKKYFDKSSNLEMRLLFCIENINKQIAATVVDHNRVSQDVHPRVRF